LLWRLGEKKLEGTTKALDLKFSIEHALLTADTIENSRDVIELCLYFFQKKLLLESVIFVTSEELSLFEGLLAVFKCNVHQFISIFMCVAV
jgi:hypothetical protein